MNFQEYSLESRKVLLYPKEVAPLYLALGLNGEAGELGEKVKKVYRDKQGKFDQESIKEIMKEAGDTLWYLNSICEELGFTLERVAEMNIEKLEDRIKRSVLQSSGDNR